MDPDTQRLARMLSPDPGSPGLALRAGVVVSIATDGYPRIQLGGSTTTIPPAASSTGMKVLGSYRPVVNDIVWVLRNGVDLLILGTVSIVPLPALAKSATVSTDQSTPSTSYTDLGTVGPAVTLTTGTLALVLFAANMFSGAGQDVWTSVAVSGATSIAASDAWGIRLGTPTGTDDRRSGAHLFALTAGSNTFTLKYRGSSGAGANWHDREIIVMTVGAG